MVPPEMSTTAIIHALLPELLKILKAIGRWLVERIRDLGHYIIGYMRGKIGDFWRRMLRARAPGRKRWLSARIRRWTRAVVWIEKNWIIRYGVYGCAVWAIEHDKRIAKIPLVAKGEREPKRRRT